MMRLIYPTRTLLRLGQSERPNPPSIGALASNHPAHQLNCVCLKRGVGMSGYRIHFYAMVGLLLTLLSLPAPAQTARPRPAESPKVIRKSNDALQASAVSRVEAVYPPLALTARISGTVFVEVSVDESGHVTSAQAFSG